MSEEHDSMADIIQAFKITPEEIVEKTIPSSELYELKIGEHVLSPFWVETLKKQIESGSPLFTPEIQIRNLGTEEWFELFNHPTFQKGQGDSQPVPAEPVQHEDPPEVEEEEEEEDDGEFYILAKGQKVGPINLNTLRKKVKTHEILVTDLISHDEGESWSKIFEMPEFDRREVGQRDHLPHLPKDNIFKGSKTEVLDNLKNGDKEGDTIFNLVHLGRKKGEEDEAPIHSTPIIEKDDDEEFFSEKTISVILIIISLIGIGYFVNDQFFAPKKRITKRSRTSKKPTVVKRSVRREEVSRPKRADAPPPPPDRRPERPPRRPSRGSDSISTIKRDRPPRMPDSSSRRRMQRKPLIEDRNYSDENRDERYGDRQNENRRDDRRDDRGFDGDRSANNRDSEEGRRRRPSRGEDSRKGAMADQQQDNEQEGFDGDQGRDVASQQQRGNEDEPYQDDNREGNEDGYDQPPAEQDIY